VKHLTQLNYVNVVAKAGSIRRAAEQLNITSTALNRRVLALEDELGTPIFERLPQGVRLNVAGELLIQHIRQSMADLSKVVSQIADLSGVRRGHVRIAGGSEIIGSFLPQRIADYRSHHSGVSFEILRRAPEKALRALQDYDADISLIFAPVPPTEYQVLATVALDICVAMGPSHPLASKSSISLVDCQEYPAIMPAEGSGLFDLLFNAQTHKGIKLQQAITSESFEFMSHYSQFENAITFLLPLSQSDSGMNNSGLVTRPFDPRDRISGLLHLVQTKGRVLPVASAKFAEDLVQYLNKSFPNATN